MASAVHCQLNPQIRLFVPTAMTSKLAYSTVQYSKVQYSTVQHRRGKRDEGEEAVSKHQIRPGDGRWTGRRGVGRLNPRRENKIQGKNGDWGATSSVCKRPAAADSQPSIRLATWCAAAVSAGARMMGRKGKVELG